MSLSLIIFVAILLGLLTMGALILALVSRHRKASGTLLQIIDAVGRVATPLQPNGAVLVQGELWPAQTVNAQFLAAGVRVRVVGTDGVQLLVQPDEK